MPYKTDKVPVVVIGEAGDADKPVPAVILVTVPPPPPVIVLFTQLVPLKDNTCPELGVVRTTSDKFPRFKVPKEIVGLPAVPSPFVTVMYVLPVIVLVPIVAPFLYTIPFVAKL